MAKAGRPINAVTRISQFIEEHPVEMQDIKFATEWLDRFLRAFEAESNVKLAYSNKQENLGAALRQALKKSRNRAKEALDKGPKKVSNPGLGALEKLRKEQENPK